MRCHFHTESDGTRHLIPGCWGVALHWNLPDKEAMKWCECPKPVRKGKEETMRELKLENGRLQALVKTLEEELKKHQC